MTAPVQDTPIVTCTIVADGDRLNFLPTFFGKYYMAAEGLLYTHARKFVQGYNGGFWNYFTLSNGGCFAALDTQETQHIVIADNYCSEHMSAEAAGITLTLFVFGRLLGANIPESESDKFIELYHKLRDFALGHPEAQSILTAID
ncbi:antirestriction protein [Pseudomonas sp. CFBP 13602]|uniref:antirestriction protein n=1 Tax=Pseudomonas sp. CFBP 13602 TaxID=2774039 RepID=UPI001786162C|nr:antirestriction protein [Pseudomonas sp. CFBP 13602]MBD8828985.1 antirestriction protein [Pseudomonas sp. CFBP 13602]